MPARLRSARPTVRGDVRELAVADVAVEPVLAALAAGGRRRGRASRRGRSRRRETDGAHRGDCGMMCSRRASKVGAWCVKSMPAAFADSSQVEAVARHRRPSQLERLRRSLQRARPLRAISTTAARSRRRVARRYGIVTDRSLDEATVGDDGFITSFALRGRSRSAVSPRSRTRPASRIACDTAPSPRDGADRPDRPPSRLSAAVTYSDRRARQRQHGLRKAGVVVAVLLPAVADQHEVAPPARRRRRLPANCSRISSPAFMIT